MEAGLKFVGLSPLVKQLAGQICRTFNVAEREVTYASDKVLTIFLLWGQRRSLLRDLAQARPVATS